MSPASYHVLKLMDHYREVQLLLESIKVLYPTRYHARWARRLRQATGLTREDVAIIALATFGTDQAGEILGVNTVITFDQRMINGYTMHFLILQRRLRAMTAQLAPPFHQASLPQVASPTF
jgi:hypothetical protein